MLSWPTSISLANPLSLQYLSSVNCSIIPNCLTSVSLSSLLLTIWLDLNELIVYNTRCPRHILITPSHRNGNSRQFYCCLSQCGVVPRQDTHHPYPLSLQIDCCMLSRPTPTSVLDLPLVLAISLAAVNWLLYSYQSSKAIYWHVPPPPSSSSSWANSFVSSFTSNYDVLLFVVSSIVLHCTNGQ